jgi:O-antigen ligase
MEDRFEKICNRIIETGWLSMIFIMPLLVTHPLTYNAYQLPRAAIFMIVVELMLIAYVAKILKAGKIRLKLGRGVMIATGLFVLSNFASLYFSAHPFKSWLGSYLRQEGVNLYVHYIFFFLLIVLNLNERRQVRKILWTVVCSSGLISFYGLAEYLNLSFTAWQNDLVKSRIFSTFGQANFFGHYLIYAIPLTAYAFLELSKKNLVRFGIALVAAGQIFCLVLTYSRAAWLAIGAELMLAAIWLVYQRRQGILSRKNIRLAVGISLSLAVIMMIFIGNNWNFVVNRIKAGSIQSRLYYWQAAVEGIKELPVGGLIFGLGQENQTDVFVRAYRPEWSFYETINTFPDRSHNALLDIILETGFFGLAAAAVFYFSIIFSGLKALFRPQQDQAAEDGRTRWLLAALLIILAGSFINNLFSFSTVATNVYAYLALALILAVVSFDRPEKTIEISLHAISKAMIFASFLFLCGVSIFLYDIKPLVADYYYNRVLLAGRDCFGIYENLNKAVSWQPDRDQYLDQYLFYGLNCLNDQTKKDRDFAIQLNIENILRMAENYRYVYSLDFNFAHAFAMLGFHYDPRYYQLAENKYVELEKINPYFTSLYRDWGRMRLWQGKYDSAEEILKKGERILAELYADPRSRIPENFLHRKKIEGELAAFYYNLAEVNFYKHNWGEAIRYYKQELDLSPYELDAYKKLSAIYLMNDNRLMSEWYADRLKVLGGPGGYN